MKALHFGRFYSSYFGGLERHVALLLSGLAKRMYVDNIVAADRWRGDVVRGDGYDVYRVGSFGVLAGIAMSPTMPLVARKLWQKHRYDVVHLHLPDPLADVCTYALPKSVRLVLSWHSDIVRQQQLFQLYRPLLDRLIARADAVIGATPKHFSSSRQLSQKWARKYCVVPYGIDYDVLWRPAYIERAAEIRRGVGGRKVIFAVGRHVYYKGFEYLIHAMRSVENAVLILGGSGPLFERNRLLIKEQGLDRRIVLTGRLNDDELRSHYHACDVFCMPSVEPSEAFGIVQLEAMGCKKPVVCCELNNGVTYVNRHGQTGWVVPPRNSEALASALNGLLSDESMRRALGEAGFNRARENFSIDSMCQGTYKVYESILGKSSREMELQAVR